MPAQRPAFIVSRLRRLGFLPMPAPSMPEPQYGLGQNRRAQQENDVDHHRSELRQGLATRSPSGCARQRARDVDDLRSLAALADVDSVEKALQICRDFYPAECVSPRSVSCKSCSDRRRLVAAGCGGRQPNGSETRRWVLRVRGSGRGRRPMAGSVLDTNHECQRARILPTNSRVRPAIALITMVWLARTRVAKVGATGRTAGRRLLSIDCDHCPAI
jgi:hypothetical protein